MSEKIRIRLLPLLFLGLLTVAGCKKEEPPKPVAPAPVAPPPQAQPAAPPPTAAQPETPAATPAPQAAPAATAPPAPTATPPAAAPAPQAAKPVATADGAKAGSRLEVQELKRVSGGTMMLRFTMINDADERLSVGYDFGGGATSDYGTVAGVHLIEPVGKKKYLVVRDSKNDCDCSRHVKDLAPKSRSNLWARFPAPPDNVEKITVVVPHFSPMDDVAISR